MSKSYYDILGVSKNASDAEIKKAFRKISKENHPDLQTGKSDNEKKKAEETFKEAAEAYETLSNKDKRASYDAQSNGIPGGHSFSQFFRRHGSMFNDIFNSNSFSGFANSAFNFNSNKGFDPNSPEDGRNVQINLTVDFNESLFGVTKDFDINIEDVCDSCHGKGTSDGKSIEPCKYCNGTGMISQQHGNMFMQSTCMYCNGSGYMNNNPCKKCNGSKRYPTKKHISVKIPAGINTGNKLRVKGKGQSGLNGGIAGDLFINICVSPSDIFKREGNDLVTKIYISPIIASLGGNVDVYSPYGSTKIKISPGTYNGHMLKIPSKGVKNGNSTGDLYAEIELEPFVNLTTEQIELLNKFNDTLLSSNFKKSEDLKNKLKQMK